MLQWALQLLGIGLPAIIKEIAKARNEYKNAETEEKRIEAQERIDVLNAKKEIILSKQKDRFNSIVQFLWAFPFLIYTWKLLIWDKVLEWGATDPLSPTLEYMMWTILGGYFVVLLRRVR